MASESPNVLAVPLERSLYDFVHEQASAAGYSDPADYVSHLIQSARRLHAERQLEASLVEGLESGPAMPMEAGDWEVLRRRVAQGGTLREHGQ